MNDQCRSSADGYFKHVIPAIRRAFSKLLSILFSESHCRFRLIRRSLPDLTSPFATLTFYLSLR